MGEPASFTSIAMPSNDDCAVTYDTATPTRGPNTIEDYFDNSLNRG